MGNRTQARVLAIMGSGETSPTMVTIHKALAERLGQGPHTAILLDTPYAFQENAADISARSQAYFARSVGLEVGVIARAGGRATSDAAAILGSDWVFAGPGSPSYALRQWRDTQVPDAFRARIAAGTGVTIIASAAAAAMGILAVPVYEIYKAGEDPYWLEGLDLLGVLGLKVAVIPHYDNAEGGTHDTRFCYLGERRLELLERELPADAAVLGVDEHTALVLDLETELAEVLGKGTATVRKAGVSTILRPDSAITLAGLRDLVANGPFFPQGDVREAVPAPPAAPARGASELPALTRQAEAEFEAAVRDRSSPAMVAAILDLESAIEAWASDTDENENSDRARAVLRGLVARLGKSADRGLADPAERLVPAIEPLIRLRALLRKNGSYTAADEIRSALAAAGIELKDSPEGTNWTLVPSS
ncbi:MAG TPA: Type 1 glutamine amidotransferase-like domain-containing protein [Streptosporangiaceae bacterium]|nr:Type 1 glutamine amidotransferase-like domain-containing protein [Streptosporangiaceae bacterium]